MFRPVGCFAVIFALAFGAAPSAQAIPADSGTHLGGPVVLAQGGSRAVERFRAQTRRRNARARQRANPTVDRFGRRIEIEGTVDRRLQERDARLTRESRIRDQRQQAAEARRLLRTQPSAGPEAAFSAAEAQRARAAERAERTRLGRSQELGIGRPRPFEGQGRNLLEGVDD